MSTMRRPTRGSKGDGATIADAAVAGTVALKNAALPRVWKKQKAASLQEKTRLSRESATRQGLPPLSAGQRTGGLPCSQSLSNAYSTHASLIQQ